MAHQTEIVVNGQTVEVTEFDHTAQEIDDGINKVNTLTGEDIPTSDTDSTSISSQLSNKVSVNPGYGNSLFGDDLNNWFRAGYYQTVGGSTTNVPPGCDGWGIVTIFNSSSKSNTWSVQLFQPANDVGSYGKALFYRYWRDSWSDWKRIAIATPPEKTSLPLVYGVSNLTEAGGSTSTFSKDQFGKVHVFAALQGQAFGNASILFTLPEDCRPPESIAINAYTNSQYNAFVKIGADGIGQIFFGNGGATCTNIVVSGDFYAAQ